MKLKLKKIKSWMIVLWWDIIFYDWYLSTKYYLFYWNIKILNNLIMIKY